MSHQLFYHDWIIDVERAGKWPQIELSLLYAEIDFDVQSLSCSYSNSEGYNVHTFVIRVGSSESLDAFSKVAEKWGFVGWELLPEDHPAAALMMGITDAQWDRLALAAKETPSVMSNSERAIPLISEEMKAAHENEALRRKLNLKENS
jgi:hypothetical protein